ncbi:MAG: ABC transporter permease [Solirubrobacterales bacterium]
MAPLGLVVVAVGLLIKQAAGVVGFLVTGIALVAGLYFPVALLPGWIEWISAVQPVTPAVELMRELIIGRSDGSILGHIARLTAFAAVMLPPAVWILTRALLASRRRGTTVEY